MASTKYTDMLSDTDTQQCRHDVTERTIEHIVTPSAYCRGGSNVSPTTLAVKAVPTGALELGNSRWDSEALKMKPRAENRSAKRALYGKGTVSETERAGLKTRMETGHPGALDGARNGAFGMCRHNGEGNGVFVHFAA